jgi:hypothetical protein
MLARTQANSSRQNPARPPPIPTGRATLRRAVHFGVRQRSLRSYRVSSRLLRRRATLTLTRLPRAPKRQRPRGLADSKRSAHRFPLLRRSTLNQTTGGEVIRRFTQIGADFRGMTGSERSSPRVTVSPACLTRHSPRDERIGGTSPYQASLSRPFSSQLSALNQPPESPPSPAVPESS